jgi:hypothetical protein
MVIAFGGLFSNIFIRNLDKFGVTAKIVNVPIAYANKEKFIVRLQQDPGLNEDTQIQLPRMSFEIVGIDYNSSRQLNKIHKIDDFRNGLPVFSYTPVPYDLTFNLYTFTRTQEDNYQIMEQILPYFTPDMNLAIKVMQNPDQTQNCILVLNNVNTDDQYDGGFEDRRYIITTYSFILKMSYFGPVLGTKDPDKHFEDGTEVSVIKKVTTNVNQMKYTADIDPFAANRGDNFDINEAWSVRVPPDNGVIPP